MDILKQLLDPELLMMIGIVIACIVIFKLFGKILARHRIIKVALVGIFLTLIVVGVFWYVQKRSDIYSESSRYYVYGEVKNISSALRKIEIDSIRSNVKHVGQERVLVNIDSKCKFVDSKGNEIRFDSIGFYDTVQIFVEEKEFKDKEHDKLTGVKVVVKEKYANPNNQ